MYNHLHVHTIIGKHYIELHTYVQLKTLMNVQSELLQLLYRIYVPLNQRIYHLRCQQPIVS